MKCEHIQDPTEYMNGKYVELAAIVTTSFDQEEKVKSKSQASIYVRSACGVCVEKSMPMDCVSSKRKRREHDIEWKAKL